LGYPPPGGIGVYPSQLDRKNLSFWMRNRPRRSWAPSGRQQLVKTTMPQKAQVQNVIFDLNLRSSRCGASRGWTTKKVAGGPDMWTWIKKILFIWFGWFQTGGSSRISSSQTELDELKSETSDRQIMRLESKVNFLTGISIGQTAILAILLVMNFIPSTSTIIFWALIAIAFVALFHKFIPSWAGWAIRTIGSLFKSGDPSKSSKESF